MGMDEVMQKEQGGEQEKSEAEARGRHEGLGGVERSPRGSARAEGGGPRAPGGGDSPLRPPSADRSVLPVSPLFHIKRDENQLGITLESETVY